MPFSDFALAAYHDTGGGLSAWRSDVCANSVVAATLPVLCGKPFSEDPKAYFLRSTVLFFVTASEEAAGACSIAGFFDKSCCVSSSSGAAAVSCRRQHRGPHAHASKLCSRIHPFLLCPSLGSCLPPHTLNRVLCRQNACSYCFSCSGFAYDRMMGRQVSVLKLAPTGTRGPLACLFGVFDGHGGDGASKFVANHLHHLVSCATTRNNTQPGSVQAQDFVNGFSHKASNGSYYSALFSGEKP